MRLINTGRAKKENVKVENNNGSSYYMNNQGLKALDFVDSTIQFLGSIGDKLCLFCIKYDGKLGYGNTVYEITNNIDTQVIKLGSLAKVKEFIANNITYEG